MLSSRSTALVYASATASCSSKRTTVCPNTIVSLGSSGVSLARLAVHVRAVGAAEIHQRPAVAAILEARVVPRHQPVAERQLRVGIAAHDQRLIDHHALAHFAAAHHHQHRSVRRLHASPQLVGDRVARLQRRRRDVRSSRAVAGHSANGITRAGPTNPIRVPGVLPVRRGIPRHALISAGLGVPSARWPDAGRGCGWRRWRSRRAPGPARTARARRAPAARARRAARVPAAARRGRRARAAARARTRLAAARPTRRSSIPRRSWHSSAISGHASDRCASTPRRWRRTRRSTRSPRSCSSRAVCRRSARRATATGRSTSPRRRPRCPATRRRRGRRRPESPERYVIESASSAGRATTEIYAPTERAAVHALYTAVALAQPDGDGQPPRVASGTVVDYPAIRTRAVLEGFYGTPYSTADRATLIRLCARLKQSTLRVRTEERRLRARPVGRRRIRKPKRRRSPTPRRSRASTRSTSCGA